MVIFAVGRDKHTPPHIPRKPYFFGSFPREIPYRLFARKRAARLLDRPESNVLVWTILGLALIGFVQVFSRYLFNYSFTWYEELGRYLGVFVAFLGASIGVKTGSHFTMDLLVIQLCPGPGNSCSDFATCCLSGGFFLLVTLYSWKIVLRMHG